MTSQSRVFHQSVCTRHSWHSGDPGSDLDPASLLTRHTPEGAFIPVFRPYTPVSANGKSHFLLGRICANRADQPGYVTFMIKKYPNGKGSVKMSSLTPGDSMLFKPL